MKAVVGEADLSIVNLECPVIKTKGNPIKKSGPCLLASPKAIDALTFAGFNLVTLANNHIYDQGETGIKETLEVLREKNIHYVGAGPDIYEAEKTLFHMVKGEK